MDDVPDQGVAYIMRNPETDLRLSYVSNDLSITKYYEFKGDRATAVRDYYLMLFAYGVRKEPDAA